MLLIALFGFQFKISKELFAPVYFGNTIKPSEAKSQPSVCFNSTANLSGNVRVIYKHQSFLVLFNVYII